MNQVAKISHTKNSSLDDSRCKFYIIFKEKREKGGGGKKKEEEEKEEEKEGESIKIGKK